MDQYISNVITEKDLNGILPGQFNVLCAPCGSGKTTFMFDDRILNFARAKKHILYLIHNTVTRDFIAKTHFDKARVYDDHNSSIWLESREDPKRKLWSVEGEDDEDYVHVMCYQTFAALIRKGGIKWLDDIDLIVWDEFDDFRGFYETEVKQLKKLLPNFSREKLVALLQEGRSTSVVNFIYQLKVSVLDPGKIRLIAVSASPEMAAGYFQSYLHYILSGKLECIYDAKATLFISGVKEALLQGCFTHDKFHRYWCFTKYIGEGREIESAARRAGFNVILLWSENNSKYRSQYSDEKRLVTKAIRDEHIVPNKYDFIITTGVLGRGIDVYDTSIQDWICDSTDYEDVIQFNRARFAPERQYLLEPVRGFVNFIRDGFNVEFYEWHNKEEIQDLINKYPVFKPNSESSRIVTFSEFKKEYEESLEKRKYGRNKIMQYRLHKETEVPLIESAS